MLNTHPACPVEMLIAPSGPCMAGKEASDRPAPSSCSVWVPVAPGIRDTFEIPSRIGLDQDSTLNGPLTLSQSDRKRRVPLGILEAKLLCC